MRWFLILLTAASAVPATAAEISKFEGMYSVSLAPKPGLDGPTCPSYDVKSLRVTKGLIQVSAGQSVLSGKIDDKGQLEGQMHKADGSKVPFKGFFQPYEYDANGIHINATIVDADCGWALSLVREN